MLASAMPSKRIFRSRARLVCDDVVIVRHLEQRCDIQFHSATSREDPVSGRRDERFGER